MSLLKVEGLIKQFGRRRVVNGVNFHVNPGEVVGLLGPNGAGKTTTFRMTTGMVTPDEGRVTFAGQDVTNWPMYRRARLGMGYLSQESSIFRKLTAEQNILAILEAMPPPRSLGRRLTRADRARIANQALEDFSLTRIRHSKAMFLSGGEKRRLEIARCLVCEPLLIMLDEPFTGIDPITINEIQKIVRKLRNENIGILLTDHNVREALKITDRSYVISDGRVLAEGTPDEIIQNEMVRSIYLGDSFAEEGFGRVDGPSHAPISGLDPGTRNFARKPASHAEGTAPISLGNPTVRAFVLIEKLRNDKQAAVELVRLGDLAVPALLDAMEQGDPHMRALAYGVLQCLDVDVPEFDPLAPEATRHRQLEILRYRFLKRAG